MRHAGKEAPTRRSTIIGLASTALAAAAATRARVAPDLPTMAEVGVPDFDTSIWFGLMAPIGTPGEIIDKLARAVPEAMKSSETQAALKSQGFLRWIKDWPSLDAHIKAWKADEDNTTQPLGLILSMEGADPILAPEQMEEWWQAGLRIVGPAHYGVSPYAHGTGTEGGFFPQGPALLKAMQRVGYA